MEPRGVSYQLDANGNYDIKNKKLVNVKNGSNNRDVVNKQQMEYYTDNNINGLKGTLESKYNKKLDSKVDYN